jgi:LacI family transcriptional regulator
LSKHRIRRLPNVALLVETTRSYGREILRGVADYARVYGPWLFHMVNEPPVRDVPPESEWSGDGIIAQPHQDEHFVRRLRECGKPVVSLSGPPGSAGVPCVVANQEAVAELALQHFRERGFVRFAYCGIPSNRIWPRTGEVLRQLAEEQGYRCDILELAYHGDTRKEWLAEVGAWLKKLDKPVGLLAGNDLRARQVLDACRVAGIFVPEEVAVLGVNNDELICEMANPPLSSIIHNARRIGYEAAAMLDGLMSGRQVAADVIIDPIGVRARQSTDLLALEDAEVVRAMRFIRENACTGIAVDDVLEQVTVSRRSLEKRFRQVVGRAIHMEIRRVQLERVKELLLQTDYKLEKIAQLTGFSTAQYLAALFHRVVKMTPGTYRAAGRAGATPVG